MVTRTFLSALLVVCVWLGPGFAETEPLKTVG